jgi:hypothetical protein
MGVSRDLETFIKENIGEDKWHELCDSFETTVVVLNKGLAGSDFVEATLKEKIMQVIGKLTPMEMELLENFLQRNVAMMELLASSIRMARPKA